MRHRRFTARTLARLAPAAFLGMLGLLGLLAAIFAPGCARKPDAPAWTNPFDPAAADPFHLTAHATESSVVLLWDAPAFADIAAYEVLRSLDNRNFDSVDETTAGVNSYFDISFIPNRVNYYKVRARNTAGEVSGTSRQVAASDLTYPRLDIAGGAQTTPTRHVTLSIVTARGRFAGNRGQRHVRRRAAPRREHNRHQPRGLGSRRGRPPTASASGSGCA